MSQSFTMAMKAGPYEVYGPGAFDAAIGSTTRVKLPSGRGRRRRHQRRDGRRRWQRGRDHDHGAGQNAPVTDL